MKTVLLAVAVLAVVMAALPASAQYQGSVDPNRNEWWFQWYNGFENYNAGPIAPTNKTGQAFASGNDQWVNPVLTGTYTNYGGTIVNDPTKAIAGNNYFQNGPGGNASIGFASARSMHGIYGDAPRQAYKEGFVEFWMYDPKGAGTATGTDTRAWVYSAAFSPTNTTTSSSYTWGATLGDSRTALGKYNWVFAMGGSFFAADGSGTTAAGGSGGGLVFTAVAGQARVRSIGWHQVQLYWNFTSAITARLEMYVDDMITPCITADLGSQNSRWANMKYVSGLYLGSTQASVTQVGRIDDISFYARNPVFDPWVPWWYTPEPSGLMALGAGLIGLLGMVRKRK